MVIVGGVSFTAVRNFPNLSAPRNLNTTAHSSQAPSPRHRVPLWIESPPFQLSGAFSGFPLPVNRFHFFRRLS